VAIIPSASYGLATVARNTLVGPSHRILVVHEQFPSNVYTWRRLCQETGAEMVTVGPAEPSKPSKERAADWNERLLTAIDRNTAVVAIPHVHWADGTIFDLETIGTRARDVGAAFIVDGTQSIGAMPFDVARIQPDAVVCAGYKWLMGPYSLGTLYVGPRYEDGVPLEENWISRRGSEDFGGLVNYEDDYQPGALRYDVGERSNFILVPMLLAGLEMVQQWTPDAIQEYCRALTRSMIDPLRSLGYDVQAESGRAAHLFGIRVPARLQIADIQRRLAARGVSVSTRGNAIRVAPHVYNDEVDVQALLEVLTESAR
jgi:selenocysteine lyase/cysteine desulfurase